MFIEHRIYSLHTAALNEYFAAFGQRGYDLHNEVVPCLGWYYSDVGPQYQMVTMWQYDSLVDRMRKRATLGAHPEWRAIIGKVKLLVRDIETRYMLPLPYWQPKKPTIKPVHAKDGSWTLGPQDYPDTMPFIEHRTYTLKPSTLQRYIDTLGPDGLAVLDEHLSCVGFYRTEAGALYQLISMWQFDSFADRAAKRAALSKRPEWQKKVAILGDFIERAESKFLFCAPFYDPTA